MSAALATTVSSEPAGNYRELSRPSATVGDRKKMPVAMLTAYIVGKLVADPTNKGQQYKNRLIVTESQRPEWFHSGPAYFHGKRVYVSSIRTTSVTTEFRALVERWRKETLNSSDIRHIVEHDAYQRIVSLGWPVVALILSDLRKEPDFWFEALTKITGEDPIIDRPEIYGDIQAMADCWLEWGENNGF